MKNVSKESSTKDLLIAQLLSIKTEWEANSEDRDNILYEFFLNNIQHAIRLARKLK